jgi:hypothetical protein
VPPLVQSSTSPTIIPSGPNTTAPPARRQRWATGCARVASRLAPFGSCAEGPAQLSSVQGSWELRSVGSSRRAGSVAVKDRPDSPELLRPESKPLVDEDATLGNSPIVP